MPGMPEKPGMRWQRPPVYQESEQSICLSPHMLCKLPRGQQMKRQNMHLSASAADRGELCTSASEQSFCVYPDAAAQAPQRPAHEVAKYAL